MLDFCQRKSFVASVSCRKTSMTSVQKVTLSLLLSVILFSAFCVLAFSGLFSLIEAHFYEPMVLRAYEERLQHIEAATDEYYTTLARRFEQYTADEGVHTYIEKTVTDDVSKYRTDVTGKLLSETAALTGIRIVGVNGKNVHFSTFENDRLKTGENMVSYRNYSEIESLPFALLAEQALPADEKQRTQSALTTLPTLPGLQKKQPHTAQTQAAPGAATADDSAPEEAAPAQASSPVAHAAPEESLAPRAGAAFHAMHPIADTGVRLYADGSTNRLIFAASLYDSNGIKNAYVLFYCNPDDMSRFLLSRNLISLYEDARLIADSFIFAFPAAGADTLAKAIEAQLSLAASPSLIVTELDVRRIADSASESAFSWVLLLHHGKNGLALGWISRSDTLLFPRLIQALLLTVIFISLYLTIFLLFNLRHDDMFIIKKRIRQFQLAFISEYFEQAGTGGFHSLPEEILNQLPELTHDIKRMLGRKAKKHEKEIDELFDHGWEEIMTALGHKNTPAPAQASVAEIKKMLEEVLSTLPLRIEQASAPVPKSAPPEAQNTPNARTQEKTPVTFQTSMAPDIPEPEVLEEIAPAGEVAEIEKADDELAGELVELEEAPAADDAEPADEVAVHEEVPTADEVAALDKAPVAEVAELEEAPTADEAAELEEAPTADEAAVLEEVPATDDAEPADEVAELEEVPTADEVAAALEEVPAADDAVALEKAPEADEATVLEETPTADEAAVLEELPATDEVAELEEVPAADDAEPADEVAVHEEVPTADEVAALDKAPVAEVAELEEAPTADEAAELEEAPTADEAAVLEEVPATDDAEPADEVAELEEVPTADEVAAALEEVPAADDAVALEKAPEADEATVLEETPVADNVAASVADEELTSALKALHSATRQLTPPVQFDTVQSLAEAAMLEAVSDSERKSSLFPLDFALSQRPLSYLAAAPLQDAIIENEDGVFSIAENIAPLSHEVNKDFMQLVHEVMR